MVGQRRRNNAASAVLSVERRMELLESRFTTPSSNHNMPAPSSPQDATVTTQASNHSFSPGTSRHSFNFDAPASRSFSGSSNQSNASNIDKALIRSKRKSSSKRSSLSDVHLAVERQMRRVMAASPLIGTHPHDASSMSVLPSPQISNLSMSNQTLLTSHVKHPAEHVKVVAESPPTLVSPALDALHSTEAQVPQLQVPVNSSVR